MKTKFKTEEQIRREVANIPRKTKNTTVHTCALDNLIPKTGTSVEFIMSVLLAQKQKAAKKLGVPESEIFVKSRDSYWSSALTYYHARPETDDEYKKRQNRSLGQRLSNLKKREKVIKQREIREHQKRKEQLKDIISNFGEEEIYNVFKEITHGG